MLSNREVYMKVKNLKKWKNKKWIVIQKWKLITLNWSRCFCYPPKVTYVRQLSLRPHHSKVTYFFLMVSTSSFIPARAPLKDTARIYGFSCFGENTIVRFLISTVQYWFPGWFYWPTVTTKKNKYNLVNLQIALFLFQYISVL